MGFIRRFVPKPLQGPLLRVVPWVKKAAYYGRRRYCPVCRSHLRRFIHSPYHPEVGGLCPVCWSLSRQRMAWLFLDDHPELFEANPCRVLHVAPEEVLERRFRACPGVDYLSIDLASPRAMQLMDVTALELDDASTDVIFCSHVLEHVQDDHKALREFFRVLRPGGGLVLMIPHSTELATTLEDPSVVTSEDRYRVYGWYDHVRLYGMDAIDRIRQAGFEVDRVTVADLVDDRQAERMGLGQQAVFLARRPVCPAS